VRIWWVQTFSKNKDINIIARANDDNITTEANATAHVSITFDKNVVEVASKNVKVYVKGVGELRSNSTDASPDMNTTGTTSNETRSLTGLHYKYGAEHYITIDASAYMVDDGRTSNDTTSDTGGDGVWNFTVATGVGPCGCDELDNCDLPTNVQ